MRDALNSTGRPIFFSLCGWHEWYAPQGQSLGNSWRIEDDCFNWQKVLNAIDGNAPLWKYAGPGGWNDPDMLMSSDPSANVYLTPTQSRTMFSLWSVMAAPLLISTSLDHISSWDLETYSNQEVIAVDQDPLGLQGKRIVGGNVSNCIISCFFIYLVIDVCLFLQLTLSMFGQESYPANKDLQCCSSMLTK
eukprot:TRINITY_DN5734_c0_g1_i1.p1 TRINITY_DN5734_c0_g1~~TRINITY_DN5734_c0_g1_i1.p1  ORF type:complete len:191 (+),score=41.77 TRINITY_DN5734_c0_g1_i1:604-1176(+)